MKLKHILKGQYLSLTTDTWTSLAKTSYVTCMVHFIDRQTWELHHFALGLYDKDGASTSHNVIEYAEHQMRMFDIEYCDLVCIVTDTEATMITAGQNFVSHSKDIMAWMH